MLYISLNIYLKVRQAGGVLTYFYALPIHLEAYEKLSFEYYDAIPIEKRHLTIVYLGAVRKNVALIDLSPAIGSLKAFKLYFKGVIPFPSASSPRYLVAPVVRGVEKLSELRKAIIEYMSKYGIKTKDKYADFRPHVSLARLPIKPDLSIHRYVSRVVKQFKNIRDEAVVDKVCLYRAEGDKYRIVASYSLSL